MDRQDEQDKSRGEDETAGGNIKFKKLSLLKILYILFIHVNFSSL